MCSPLMPDMLSAGFLDAMGSTCSPAMADMDNAGGGMNMTGSTGGSVMGSTSSVMMFVNDKSGRGASGSALGSRLCAAIADMLSFGAGVSGSARGSKCSAAIVDRLRAGGRTTGSARGSSSSEMIDVIVRSGRGISGSAKGSTLWFERGVKVNARGVGGTSTSSLGSTSSDAIEDMLRIGETGLEPPKAKSTGQEAGPRWLRGPIADCIEPGRLAVITLMGDSAKLSSPSSVIEPLEAVWADWNPESLGTILTGSVITPVSTMMTFGRGGTAGRGDDPRRKDLMEPGVMERARSRLGVPGPAESSSLPSKSWSSANKL
ncbi:hypothetical protein HG531_012984 [Fusarium graminearum]|nr:hypothetical protein HG531_012984 [Fusarium graminearum]